MFKKPAKLGNSTAFKQKDRKTLIKSIELSYPSLAEGSPKVLLPELCTITKFQTHTEIHGSLYSDANKVPLWFTVDQRSDLLIPTLYTLWRPAAEGILPVVSTHGPVVAYLTSGSDLMRPGVINFPLNLAKNSLVSVEADGKAVAVGRLADNSNDLKARDSGKAVIILHALDDCLFVLGSGKDIQYFEEASPVLKDDITSLSLSENQAVSQIAETELITTRNSEAEPSERPAQDVVDHTILIAFMSAIANMKSMPTGTLPMAASQFYSAHILPRRPANLCSIENSEFMTIKNSQWKTLAKFFKAMDQRDYCKIKEHKSDIKVVTVNAEHADIIESVQKKYKTIEKETIQKKEIEKNLLRTSDQGPSTSYKIISAYRPNEALTSLLSPIKPDVGQYHYTPATITSRLKEYVVVNNLIPSTDKSYIRLDAILTKALLKKGETETFLKRQDALERVLQAPSAVEFHAVQQPGKDMPPLKKGHLKPISLSVKQRRSKIVTLIHDLDSFGLNPDEVAEELRKHCASSTSVGPIQGAKANDPGREVMVQGDKILRVSSWLIEKGIPKKYIIT